jgi:hypothetical protein
MVPDKETGELSKQDQLLVQQMASTLEQVKNTATEARMAADEAAAAAKKATEEATVATSTALEKDERATQTVEAVDNIQGYDQQRRATISKKTAVEAKRDKAEKEKQRKDAERDLETDIVPLGREAADAARGIDPYRRVINPEGFNTVAAKIAKKGNPAGDKLDLASMLSKISKLVDMIPDSKSQTDEAQKLREVESKLEKKIADLKARMDRKS